MSFSPAQRPSRLLLLSLSLSLTLATAIRAASPAAKEQDQISQWNHEALLAETAKKSVQAEALLRKVIKALEKEGGSELSLADAQNNLRLVLLKEGKNSEAKLLQGQSASIRKKFRIHEVNAEQLQELPGTIETRHIVDKMFQEITQAIDGHDPLVTRLPVEPSLENFRKVQQNSWSMRRAGNPQKAAVGFRIALAIANKLPEKPNPQQVDALGSLAAVYRITGRNMAAVMLYDATRETQEKIDKKNNIPTSKDAKFATILDNAALALCEIGDYQTALAWQKESLAIYQNTQEAESEDIGQAMANLALTYSQLGQQENAEEQLNRAIQILEKKHAKDSPQLLVEYDNLASIYFKEKKYEKSEQLRKEVLEGFRKKYSQPHPDLALAISNLAATYAAEKKYDLAEPLLKEFVAMDEQIFGAGSPKTMEAKAQYAELLQKMGRSAEAAKLLKSLQEAQKPVPSAHRVLQAISVMMQKPLSPELDSEQQIVLDFADKSPDVSVLIAPQFVCLPRESSPKFERVFLAYYIAGSVKQQLENKKSSNKDGSAAAVPAAIKAELFVYEQLKKRIPNYKNDFLEKLKEIDSKGDLPGYVQEKLKH